MLYLFHDLQGRFAFGIFEAVFLLEFYIVLINWMKRKSQKLPIHLRVIRYQ